MIHRGGMPHAGLTGSEIWKRACGTDKNCVEVAGLADGRVAIRDSKDLTAPPLVLEPESYGLFLAAIKRGDH
ncbi:DUF397 domain-containing protein [Nonomuraea sp. MCN248]|uniref:DUF397 domain-containing protein n=1 Tax=Nonomuraea corallina TaxID=2989783 RepID=A0ABT4S8H4_9ACTN|nr:DUF397 domain-containing protein [Nonomuraea corallina]MDA0633523.1 DUF397 domain-containing protein [Nonomuraea corallina]